MAATRCSYNLRGDSVGPSQTLARRTKYEATSFVNVAQSNFRLALRAFGDETVNQPLFFPLIAVLAVSDGFAPQHVRIVRFRTLRCLAKYKGQTGVPEAPVQPLSKSHAFSSDLFPKHDFKLDSAIFLQTLKAFSCDGTEVGRRRQRHHRHDL